MPAFFRASVSDFLTTSTAEGLDRLTAGLAEQGFDLTPDQRAAWVEEWPRLQTSLQSLSQVHPAALHWALLLEYPIPGRQKRIDAVLLTPNGIIVVEFKSGDEVSSAARWQTREYCWNLRDFHRESRGVPLAPVLCVAELARHTDSELLEFSDRHQLMLDLQTCNPGGLTSALIRAFERLQSHPRWDFNLEQWDKSPVQPTPSVIEFAQQIFGGHDVREIVHSTSDNTDAALDRVRMAMIEARRESKRIICFVTGVPGAGKTLVGLNVAYRAEMVEAAGGPVCFASGNKPLLDVLKTALVRNRSRGSRQRREVGHDLTAPVQDVHEYVRVTLSSDEVQAPPFQAIVFDEAQRVWDAEKLLDGLTKRKRRRQLSQEQMDRILSQGSSEPELLLSLMERCPWCVVVALVGGGQEIHTGEAGLGAWGKALAGRKKPWSVWASKDALDGGVGSASQRLFGDTVPNGLEIFRHDDLHLSVSKRCFRAERYAEWVNHFVYGNDESARKLAAELSEFPVFVARDLSNARDLIRCHADTGLRCGLLASSGAVRLRADGIEVSPEFRASIKFPDWFLRPTGDIRSSSQLEVAATEFECQGLELDWCCVCWGNDFVVAPNGEGWQFQRLRSPGGFAPRWNPEEDTVVREFVRNKYRVLLTRARTGVVIFIPRGSNSDSTHSPEGFNATAKFLQRCGAVLC